MLEHLLFSRMILKLALSKRLIQFIRQSHISNQPSPSPPYATSTGEDMNAKQKADYADIVELIANDIRLANAALMREAAQGHARYEALRLLNPQQFAELWSRALLGRNFDELVDELVKAKNEPK